MALQFIIGSSARQNRELLISRMMERSENEDGEMFFFVPEQANLEAERSLTERRRGGCVMRIDIVSFRRLLHRLTDELGNRVPPILDDTGKSLLLRRVLSEHAKELPRFGGKANKQGFLAELKSLLSEFVRYEVTSEALSEVSKKTEDTLFSDKLSELSEIYQWFREKCGETHITEDDIYNAMCPLVRESKRLKGSVLYFDGYTGFTPTQYNLIGELIRMCKDIVITVTIDPQECDPGHRAADCFRMSRETIGTMRKLAEASGVQVLPDIVAPGDGDNRAAALTYISEALFRRGFGAFSDEAPDSVRLVSAADRSSEVRALTREIMRLVRKEGVSYREIAVVCGDAAGYEENLNREFGISGIPFFLDRTSEVSDNCLIDYIRSLLEMLYTDMRTDVVMRWLKNPINGFNTDDLNYLENYLLARGIRGLSMWTRGFAGNYYCKRVTKHDRCIALASEITSMLLPLAEVMNDPQTGVAAKTEALYAFLTARKTYQCMLSMSESVAKENVPWRLRRSAEYHAIYKAVIELLSRVHTLFPEPAISLRDYMGILEAGFAEMQLGVIPPERDCVMIGDCKRSRFASIRYMFFLGVNEGKVPGSGHGSELLNCRERELLKNDYRIALADTEKEAIDSEEFNILLVLQKPTERLIVSWACTDDEGKAVEKSYVVRRIQRLFPKLTVTDAEAGKATFFDRIAADGGIGELLKEYTAAAHGTSKDATQRAALGTLYDWYVKDGEGRGLHVTETQLEDAERGLFRQQELSSEIAQELFPRDREFSVTRLEEFAACPFRHFAKYGLTAEERETYAPTQLESGSAFHAILEYAGAKIAEQGAPPDEETLLTLLREGAKSVEENPDFECFFANYRSRHLYRSIVRNLEFTAPYMAKQLQDGNYELLHTEEKFSENFGEFRFGGKIDRVDICRDGDRSLIKIVDYKTSGKEFKTALIDAGIDIQLPLYLRVEEKRLRAEGVEAIPAAALYLPLSMSPVDGLPDNEKSVKKVDSAMTPEGIVLVEKPTRDDRYLQMLDSGFAQTEGAYDSKVIPVGFSANGNIKGSSFCTEEEMKDLLDRVEKLAIAEAERIVGGEISIAPYRYGNGVSAKTACTYCPYRGLCRAEKSAAVPYRVITSTAKEETEE